MNDWSIRKFDSKDELMDLAVGRLCLPLKAYHGMAPLFAFLFFSFVVLDEGATDNTITGKW